jgi:hypothetical protein
VQGAQREVLPVTSAGTKPIVLELAPSIFTWKSKQITVSWGPGVTPAS